jgi:exopolyphosphatase/guanosine-5'-triphosphate,3'-diphosphate pyrophosphatase
MKAIIDLGTNTFHLLIADVSDSSITVMEKLQIPVMLGRGGVHQNKLADDAVLRAFEALAEFKLIIHKYKIEAITVVGTAAIRDALNGAAFINEVNARFGFNIKAISGQDEAMYIFNGVSAALSKEIQSYLVMDIGGGSVEFILVQNGQPQWMQSFRAGASRLIQQFHISDPITKDEIQTLEQYFSEMFEPLMQICSVYRPNILVGSAGSFETVIDIILKDFEELVVPLTPNADEVHQEQFIKCSELLIHSTANQRHQMKGMASFRVDMIVVAMLMTRWVMKQCNLQRLIVSQYALKEGLLISQ